MIFYVGSYRFCLDPSSVKLKVGCALRGIHMQTTYLEWLPDDILRYELFSHLHYHEREAVNRVLPKSYHISTKLDSRKLIRYDIMAACVPLKQTLKLISPLLHGKAREDILYMMMSECLPSNLIIAQYNAKYRMLLYQRINYFLYDINSEYNTCSPDFKPKMYKACNTLNKLLSTNFAYKYEVACMDEKTSPVDL